MFAKPANENWVFSPPLCMCVSSWPWMELWPLSYLPAHMYVSTEIDKYTEWKRNVAGIPVGDQTNLAFVSACVRSLVREAELFTIRNPWHWLHCVGESLGQTTSISFLSFSVFVSFFHLHKCSFPPNVSSNKRREKCLNLCETFSFLNLSSESTNFQQILWCWSGFPSLSSDLCQ